MNFSNIKSMYFEGKKIVSAWLNGKKVWVTTNNNSSKE